MLDPSDVFIVDVGAVIYAWIGKQASKQEKAKGMQTVTVDVLDPPLPAAWRSSIPLDRTPWALLELSTIPSWAKAAEVYGDLVGDAIDPEGLEDLVAEVKDAPDRAEAVRRAVRGVQDRIRYTGVEFGIQAIVAVG